MKESGSSIDLIRRLVKLDAFTSVQFNSIYLLKNILLSDNQSYKSINYVYSQQSKLTTQQFTTLPIPHLSGFIFQHFEDNTCCGLALGSTWRVMAWSQKAGKREAFMEVI